MRLARQNLDIGAHAAVEGFLVIGDTAADAVAHNVGGVVAASLPGDHTLVDGVRVDVALEVGVAKLFHQHQLRGLGDDRRI